MNAKAENFCPAVMLFVLWFVYAGSAAAQIASATISGKVTDSAGAAVANATVTVKNSSSGQSVEAQTDSSGAYSVKNLVPGRPTAMISS